MIKIIFGVIFAGTIYYVLHPLLGRRVTWIDAEDPDDERLQELEMEKRINLKALKDIEFELASSKINDEDYTELREHYARKVSRVMDLIEDVKMGGEAIPEDEEAPDQYADYDEDDDDYFDEDLQPDEDWDDGDWDEDQQECYPRRSMLGPAVLALSLLLAAFTGAALYQMGKKSAQPGPTTPIASRSPLANSQVPPLSSEKAGLDHLVQYVQENPWNVTSHLILGEYYFGEGNTDLALSHFMNAEAVDPEDSRVLYSLGKAYRVMGKPDQAIEKLEAAAKIDPDSLQLLYQLGLVYGYDKGDQRHARELFEEILTRNPDQELRATVNEELRRLEATDG